MPLRSWKCATAPARLSSPTTRYLVESGHHHPRLDRPAWQSFSHPAKSQSVPGQVKTPCRNGGPLPLCSYPTEPRCPSSYHRRAASRLATVAEPSRYDPDRVSDVSPCLSAL